MRGDIRDKALELLEPLYEADFVDDGWPRFMRRLMGAMESDIAAAVCLNPQGRPFELLVQGDFSESMAADYNAHFAAIEPWAEAFLSLKCPFGKSACSQDVLAPGEFERTEYYNDFWRPNGDLFHTCGTLVRLDNGFANVGFPRSRGRGVYDTSDIAFLDLLSPHIATALRMHHRLGRERFASASALAALDRMEDAIILVDDRGCIVHANPSAEAELKSGQRLSVRNGRLMAGRQTAQSDLDHALHSAAALSRFATTQEPMNVATREGDSALRASISFYPLPNRQGNSLNLGQAGVLVMLCEARNAQVASASLLRALYGLTPMEANIAQGLSLGHGLEEVAASMGIGLGTVRTHLKHVFVKTGTRRQSQLVSLLNRVRPKMSP